MRPLIQEGRIRAFRSALDESPPVPIPLLTFLPQRGTTAAMPTIVDTPTPNKYFASHVQRLEQARWLTGRPKGAKNKIPVHIRMGIVQVYERLGGPDGLLAWAMDNPDTFYGSVLPRVLPAELAESGHGSGITVIIQRTPQATISTEKPLVILPSPDQGGASAAGPGA